MEVAHLTAERAALFLHVYLASSSRFGEFAVVHDDKLRESFQITLEARQLKKPQRELPRKSNGNHLFALVLGARVFLRRCCIFRRKTSSYGGGRPCWIRREGGRLVTRKFLHEFTFFLLSSDVRHPRRSSKRNCSAQP